MLQVALAVRQKGIYYVLTQLGLIATLAMAEAGGQQQHCLGWSLRRRTTVVEMGSIALNTLSVETVLPEICDDGRGGGS